MSKNSKSDSFVNFVVLYGQNSEYWKQEMNGDSMVTLCIDHVIMSKFPTSLVIIAQNNHPSSKVGINIMVTKKDLSLKINERRNVSISDDAPATFLVKHSARDTASGQDTFIINVDAAEEYDKD